MGPAGIVAIVAPPSETRGEHQPFAMHPMGEGACDQEDSVVILSANHDEKLHEIKKRSSRFYDRSLNITTGCRSKGDTQGI